MKKRGNLSGLITLLAIIGFIFTACPEPKNDPGLSTNPTPGLAFALINGDTAYSVSRGTASSAEVVIPEIYKGLPVIEIAKNGFSSYTSMTSIAIPNRIISIGDFAFSACSGLTSITIPASVIIIGNNAFTGCSSLTSITIPFVGTVLNGDAPFGSIFGASSASNQNSFIPASLETVIITGSAIISDNAFTGCSGLASVTIPASVIVIGNNSFSNCTSLTRVAFMGKLTESYFSSASSFPGDLRTKYFADDGGIGTYSRPDGTTNTWTGAPTGLSITAPSSSSTLISWNPVPGADGYRIYRSASSNDTFAEVGTSTTYSYSDNGLEEGANYYYKIAASYDNGSSPLSRIISIISIPIEGVSLNWNWEVTDDSNPNKFAPGISILNGYTKHPTKYSQAFVLNEAYIKNNPNTGWYKKITEGGLTRVLMEDARGYDPRGSLLPTDPNFNLNYAWPNNKGEGDLIPLKVPLTEKTIGPYGEEVDAFRLWGTLMQKGSESGNPDDWVTRTSGWYIYSPITTETDYRLGCGWPAITLYATPPTMGEDPEQETRTALINGYGYTFWVKSMKDYQSYRTSVKNWDYRPNENHEPGHWYGLGMGRDGTPETFTPAQVGEWKQIKVIYDRQHPDFNMAVNNWILQYDIMNDYPSDMQPYTIAENHNKEHSIRIAFEFQLEHNGGSIGNYQVDYSVVSGRHEYDVYIYGLEILQYKD